MITLVLGGNKSGKSAFALDLLQKGAKPGLFVATGKARDFDFRRQIQKHRVERGPEPEVIEVNRDLPQTLRKAKADFSCVLVDSLDYWLFSIRESGFEKDILQVFTDELSDWNTGSDLILVSCEAGLGPLPASSGVRAFIRSLGALNQTCANIADEAYLVAAGLPLTLKKA